MADDERRAKIEAVARCTCGHAWSHHVDDANGCVFCGCQAFAQAPQSNAQQLDVLAETLTAGAQDVRTMGRPALADELDDVAESVRAAAREEE
jgi:predicted  nucleic acid-binding Zn-ribbon protein